ncbi:endonuclease III [Kocuria salsicia]|uniref:Endonuclease III n=1 Tax=Kocuria salsicia TaxID=664639 RepID=A0ABV3KB53_9MICC|nr:endonuclease III [Kocuria rhizophila]
MDTPAAAAHVRFVTPRQADQAAARRRRARAETDLSRTRRARRIQRVLAQTYPYAVAELDFDDPWQLLVATVLSAQTTDIRVNEVTPRLFAAYPGPRELAEAPAEDVQEVVRSLGFYRSKVRSIQALATRIVDEYDGAVPGTVEDLVSLPGVGRKTANVVLGNAFDVPGITVDTHFGRLARRLGWTENEDPVKVEKDVAALFPSALWTELSHELIYHGRRICHSRKPACGVCPVADLCPSYGAGPTDPDAARKLLGYELKPGREDLLAGFMAGRTRRQLRAEGHTLSA